MLKAIFFDWGYAFAKGFQKGDQELNKILGPFYCLSGVSNSSKGFFYHTTHLDKRACFE